MLGPKLAVPVATGTSIGFEAGVRFLASASSLAFSPSSTSLWFGPLATLDLRPLAGVPLRLHVNANFYVDNSKNVYDLSTATPESRQAAKFAYGIGASRVRLAAGIDAPLEKYTGPVPLRPFAEYHAEIVTAAADPALVDVSPLGGPRDRQWLTFGLRAQVYRGATLDVGADVRLRSTGLAYEPPLPPYAVIFGASYPLDVDAFSKPVIVTQVIEKKVEAPPTEGRIAGVAKDKSGKGIGARDRRGRRASARQRRHRRRRDVRDRGAGARARQCGGRGARLRGREGHGDGDGGPGHRRRARADGEGAHRFGARQDHRRAGTRRRGDAEVLGRAGASRREPMAAAFTRRRCCPDRTRSSPRRRGCRRRRASSRWSPTPTARSI